MNDAFRKLIDEAPEKFSGIAELWDLSSNYKYPTPATVFLDLIGYTLEEYGYTLVTDWPEVINTRLGYYELSVIAGALDEYTTRPDDSLGFIEQLLLAEGGNE